jgi:Ca2+-binding RTX toxin-like protein
MSSPGSVQTRVLRPSTGPQVSAGQQIWVFYAGELLDGTPFDANFNFTTFQAQPGRSPFPFVLGAGQVIQGWDQALAERRLGEVLELTIPSELAYGSSGSPPRIPADADLRFTVELLAISGSGGYIFATWNDIGVDLRPAAALGAQPGDYPSQLVGLDGNDALVGDDADDLLAALRGNDSLSGLNGDDLLVGGAGNDRLAGGLGNDILDGGDGADTAAFGGAGVTVNLSRAAPQQTGEGLDSLVSIENVTGGDGDDQITGNTLANVLAGADGNDRLNGGGGADRLSGGLGADRFLYSQPADSGPGRPQRDTITDFRGRSGDRIDLSALDANALRAGNQTFRFIGSRAFSGQPGEARFASGLLQMNTNADRLADLAIVLSGVTSLQGGFLVL